MDLPQWLTQLIPEPQPHCILANEGDNWLITLPSGKHLLFADLKSAHQWLIKENWDFRLAREDLFLSYPSERAQLETLVLGYTDVQRRANLEREYAKALDAAKHYRDHPDSFSLAWRFVNTHPVFWTYQPEQPWFWTTECHCSQIYQNVFDDRGQVTVELETGPHVSWESEHSYGLKPYTVLSHDYRLDAVGSTFEEAMISLASKVDKYYFSDGSERISTDEDQPEFIREALRRAQELDQCLASDKA